MVEVPSGPELDASYRVSDFALWMTQCLLHQPPASDVKCQLPPNKKQLHNYFHSAAIRQVLSFHYSRFRWPKGQKDIHHFVWIWDLRHGWEKRSYFQPSSLFSMPWAHNLDQKVSEVNIPTGATKFFHKSCTHVLHTSSNGPPTATAGDHVPCKSAYHLHRWIKWSTC